MTTKSFYGKNLTTFSGFKGVDFSSSPLDVAPHRASNMENFISDFGILKKRNGYKQMREFSDKDGNRFPVCGIFSYKIGDVSHVLVHAGDRFLRLTENGYERVGAQLTGLTATRSEAYMQKGRMYIVGCGDFLVYGTWDGGATYELRRVYNDEDTYVPMTMTNISADTAPEDAAATLDDVNLLTPWRRNGLSGVVPTTLEGVYYDFNHTYHLDSLVQMLSKVTLKVINTEETLVFEDVQDEPFTDENSIRAGYRRIDALGNIYLFFDNENRVPTGGFTIVSGGDTYTCSGGKIMRGNSNYGTYEIDGPLLVLSGPFTSGNIVVNGYTVSVPIERTLSFANGARCTLNYLSSTLQLVGAGGGSTTFSDIGYGDGGDVFEVTFCAIEAAAEGVVPYERRVTGCSFGTLFGVDGASDRLFLTGNPLLKNVEFYSYMDDFTYFPDTYTVTVGSDNIPIVGYLRLSDGTLAVFKEKRGMGDATIYYRAGYYKEYTDDDGATDRIDPVFPTVAGNMGESMISRFASTDFGGDKLFLSENGVFAVALSENITVGERYSRERSRMVNARLTREKELEEAVAVVYKNKYYLAINGNVYVADSRYRSTRSDNMDSAWGYEWWFLTGIPARVFAEIDGELWFGTRDGRLCRFDEEYSDRTYTLYRAGDLDASAARLTANSTIDPLPAVGDTFSTSCALYGVAYTGFSHVLDGRIYHEDLMVVAHMAEGERVYMDDGKTLAPCEIRDVDLMESCFSLYKDGELVAVDSAGFSLVWPLWGVELDVVEVDGAHFKVGRFGKTLELVTREVSILTGRLWHKRAVCAKWVSAVTALGSTMVGKNLYRLSISHEPTVCGKMSFGYSTRLAAYRTVSPGVGSVFSFDTLDFSSFSFETGFASSYSVRIFERNVNYIALTVESDNDAGCAFSALEVLWNNTRLIGGLR